MSLLHGVRVVELTTAWAGPFIGRFLGALGADVVKVESARHADGWRMPAAPKDVFPDFPEGVPDGVDPEAISFDVAPNFNAINRNKRGIALDLTTERGREVLLRLVAVSDVVCANFTHRVLPSLRLDYDDLRAVKPDVVLLTMPALGASGPYRAAVGYGTIVEGMGGFASRFGYPDEGARVSDTYYPDAVAGVHATVAVLAALRRRQTTGEGSFVDLSQQEAVWLQLGETIAFASRHGRDPERLGNAEPGCAVSGSFATADGRHVAIVTRTPAEADTLADMTGDVAAWARRLTLDVALEKLRAAGVGAAPVHTYLTAERDAALGFERVPHPVAGERSYLRVPLRVDGEPVTTRRPAPRFDEHTREVLTELAGCSSGELDLLEADGVTGGQPGGPERA